MWCALIPYFSQYISFCATSILIIYILYITGMQESTQDSRQPQTHYPKTNKTQKKDDCCCSNPKKSTLQHQIPQKTANKTKQKTTHSTHTISKTGGEEGTRPKKSSIFSPGRCTSKKKNLQSHQHTRNRG